MKGIDFMRVVSADPDKYIGQKFKGKEGSYIVKKMRHPGEINILKLPIENKKDDTKYNIFRTVSTSLKFINDDIECNDEIQKNGNNGFSIISDIVNNRKDFKERILIDNKNDIYLVAWHEELNQYIVVNINDKMCIFAKTFQEIYAFLYSPIIEYETFTTI